MGILSDQVRRVLEEVFNMLSPDLRGPLGQGVTWTITITKSQRDQIREALSGTMDEDNE